jgi:hypothetical protein
LNLSIRRGLALCGPGRSLLILRRLLDAPIKRLPPYFRPAGNGRLCHYIGIAWPFVRTSADLGDRPASLVNDPFLGDARSRRAFSPQAVDELETEHRYVIVECL